MSLINPEDVFYYVIAVDSPSYKDIDAFYFKGNPLLFGDLEDACDDLRYVNNLTGVPHKILRVKFEEI